jgi:OmcA/MtrC family decaheme c-type cytochrome
VKWEFAVKLIHRGWESVARVTAIILALALTLSSATRSPYTAREKAFFANAATVQFVRPGLTVTINSAKVAADGTITVVYTLTDPAGLPLDASGITTPGTMNISYIAAVLPNDQAEYTAYTTKAASGPAVPSTNQPSADSGGVVTNLAPGQYQYVFQTKAPSGFDQTATHTIGIYASRDLTVYDLGTNYASATFNFVPNGANVTKIHDVIKTASCNSCHDQLSFHGGRRRGIDMCALCHTQQLVDTSTGGVLALRVMIHQIHMGASTPSVIAGTPLIIGGTDFSKVVYPADPGDPRRCETCHSQTSGATQATNYLTKPTRAACGACHSDVNFATGANHPGGPQFDDNQCANCHIPQGEIDFDASIKGAHVAPTESSLLGGIAVAITKISNGTAGSKPTVAYTIKDGSGKPLAPSKLSSLSFVMAGPASDYGYTSFGSDVTTPGYVSESALTAGSCASDGSCLYTFLHAVPAKATGTYSIGVEARRSETVLAGTTSAQTIQYGAKNQVMSFAVDGSTVAPRRQVVATSSCNGCHVALSLHGSLRNQTEYCVLCHNPSNTDAAQRPNADVPADQALPPQGINFNLLVHRIHTGANLPPDRPYVVVGFGGSHNDFSGVLYAAMSPTGSSGDTRNCAMCHVNDSHLNLPAGKNAVTDPQGPINPVQPITSACTGCHVDIATASHALSNSNQLGEGCPVCHASGSAFAVDQVHAQY